MYQHQIFCFEVHASILGSERTKIQNLDTRAFAPGFDASCLTPIAVIANFCFVGLRERAADESAWRGGKLI